MSHYEAYLTGLSSRLLSLVNTSSYSSSYGCFDKNYWHFKTSDFPNAAKQQGICGLAKFYNFKHKDNGLYKSQKVLDIITGGISFLKDIQKNDGSFDEWYYNERGWAGPTAYLVHALYDTYQEIKDDISKELKSTIISIFQKASPHLIESDEKHPLANHIAIAMLALVEINDVHKDANLIKRYDELLDQLESFFNQDEGWTLEYDGADPGYQSATLSFLARIHRINNCKRVERICLKSLEFIEKFCYPDGTFSLNMGSRHTTNIFYFGVEYFRETTSGSRISNWIEDNFHSQTLPLDHDDNYFLYRVHELFDAYYESINKNTQKSAKIEYKSFNYPQAGIEAMRKGNVYIIISHSRGSVLQVFDIEKKELIAIDNGLIVKNKKNVYTSLWFNGKEGKRNLTIIKEKHFTVFTFILFRLFFIIFARNRKLAYNFKNMIKHILIFNKKPSKHFYTRDIVIQEDQVLINDYIEMSNDDESHASFGDHYYSRYVPQSSLFNSKRFSNYFEVENITFKSELKHTRRIKL